MAQPQSVPESVDPGKRQRERTRAPEDLPAIREKALRAALIALDLKAEDIRVLDMHELVSYTDFLVICTGRSTRQTRRVAEEIGFRLKKEFEILPGRVEGEATGEWVLMDFLDFIVHIFTPEMREFYRLDVLWKSAPVETVAPPEGM